jgi:integrase
MIKKFKIKTMSLRGSKHTSNALAWNEAQSLILKLERDNRQAFALIVAVGCYTGLRISDILTLTWEQITGESFEIQEGKTGKTRTITVSPTLKEIMTRNRNLRTGKIFVSKRGQVFTVQYINQEFKRIEKKYGIKGNFSTHSLRKTFGRHVWEMDNNSERSLIMLSKIFNHTHSDVTRIYLGITDQEISDIYINL